MVKRIFANNAGEKGLVGHVVHMSQVKCLRGHTGHICHVGDTDHVIHTGQTGHMGCACLAHNLGNTCHNIYQQQHRLLYI